MEARRTLESGGGVSVIGKVFVFAEPLVLRRLGEKKQSLLLAFTSVKVFSGVSLSTRDFTIYIY